MTSTGDGRDEAKRAIGERGDREDRRREAGWAGGGCGTRREWPRACRCRRWTRGWAGPRDYGCWPGAVERAARRGERTGMGSLEGKSKENRKGT